MDTLQKQEKSWTKTVAKILSVILVITLLVAPVLTVAFSLMNAKIIANVVTASVEQELRTAQKKKKPVEYVLENLPDTFENSDDVEDILADVFGESSTKEVFDEVMDSDVAEEFLSVYTEDLANSLTGKSKEPRLNEKKLKQLTKSNMDEILEIAQNLNPNLTERDLADLEKEIIQLVDENAKDIIDAIPNATKMKRELTKGVPGMGILLGILKLKDVITAVFIGLMVLLSAGIVVCRLQALRGFKTLAVDLFIGGSFNGLVCAGFWLIAPVISDAISVSVIGSVAEAVLNAVAGGLLLWAGAMLLLGGALLAAYLIVKKQQAKKALIITEEV